MASYHLLMRALFTTAAFALFFQYSTFAQDAPFLVNERISEVIPVNQSNWKRQAICGPATAFSCDDGDGCCLWGQVCTVVSGYHGCCPSAGCPTPTSPPISSSRPSNGTTTATVPQQSVSSNSSGPVSGPAPSRPSTSPVVVTTQVDPTLTTTPTTGPLRPNSVGKREALNAVIVFVISTFLCVAVIL